MLKKGKYYSESDRLITFNDRYKYGDYLKELENRGVNISKITKKVLAEFIEVYPNGFSTFKLS